jgi:hypothetical protein
MRKLAIAVSLVFAFAEAFAQSNAVSNSVGSASANKSRSQLQLAGKGDPEKGTARDRGKTDEAANTNKSHQVGTVKSESVIRVADKEPEKGKARRTSDRKQPEKAKVTRTNSRMEPEKGGAKRTSAKSRPKPDPEKGG